MFFSSCLSLVYPHAALFLIVVSCSHCARDKEAPLPQHHAPSSFFDTGEMAPSPQRKKNKTILIFVSFVLSFLGCGEGPKKARAALGVFVVIERARKKACLLQFIFDHQLACIRIYLQNLFAGQSALGRCTLAVRALAAPAEAFVSCRVFFLGGSC